MNPLESQKPACPHMEAIVQETLYRLNDMARLGATLPQRPVEIAQPSEAEQITMETPWAVQVLFNGDVAYEISSGPNVHAVFSASTAAIARARLAAATDWLAVTERGLKASGWD